MTDGGAATAPTDEEEEEEIEHDAWTARRVAGWLVRLPSRYRVSLCVYLAPVVATLVARWALGEDPSPTDVRALGYGLPALEAGRVWTPATGAIVDRVLAISFVPGYTFVAVVLQEHKARHWRTAVTVVGGQIGGVLLGLLLVLPLRGRTSPFAIEQTQAIDFGISVGGFACLGAWSAYLGAPFRRPLRGAVSAYLLCQLLLSGLIFDVSHPVGWILGVVGGTYLMRPVEMDRRAVRWPADGLWIALGVVLGAAVGVVAGWNGGGVGGLFGWGPLRA